MNQTIRVFLTHIVKHKLTRILLGTYLLYLAISILVISPLINMQASHWYQQQTGRPLHFEVIHFNPFTFSLTLRNANDNNPDGSPLWSVRRVFINVAAVKTLLGFTPTIDEIRIDQPWAHPQILSDSQWNFADILQHHTKPVVTLPEPSLPEADKLRALVINNIQILNGTLQFTDKSLKKPIAVHIDNISFDMQNLSTLADDKQAYLLRARVRTTDATKTQGELLWQGNLSLNEEYDQGTLALKDIILSPFWPYIKSHFNFTLHKATASVTGEYHIQWKNTLDWSISQGQLQLENIGLTSGKKATRNAELTTNKLLLDKIDVTSKEQSVKIASVIVDGLQMASWSQGSDSGVMRAFTFTAPQDDAAPNTSPEWTFAVNALSLKNASVDWRVAELEQHNFLIRKLNVNATPLDFSGRKIAAITLGAIIDANTRLSLDGALNLNSLDGEFNSNLQGLSLAIAKPLFAPYLNVNNVSGVLDANAYLEIRNAQLQQLKTNGKLADVKLQSTTATQELLTWENLTWNDANLDFIQQKVDVPLITLSGLDGRLIISKDGKTNLQGLFPKVPEEETTEPDTTWQFRLHKLGLDKASFRFHDESLTPNFTAAVQNFTGAMTNFSSDPNETAIFSFTGDVDSYAPVKLQGKTKPFSEQPQLDAQLDFENMDLGGFSGYSSTYAGWRIERGLLTANLHYRLADGLIAGDNHIEMDQLQLGERVKSATAMDVPLRLALALVTDENGLATLDFDVSGKPDAPDFDISKILWSAVRNTIVKIVKSPLTFLAMLVGSKEDLGELPFNSGSSKLLATATRKLNTLQQAMDMRPALRIELRGSYDPVTDKLGLQAAQITQILLDSGLTNKDIKAKNQRWQAAIAKQYRKLDLGNPKSLPAEKMYEQWLQTIAVSEEQLTILAASRSVNAKQFLVQHLKIDNNRVLINTSLDCDKPKFCNRRLVRIDLSDISQLDLAKTP